MTLEPENEARAEEREIWAGPWPWHCTACGAAVGRGAWLCADCFVARITLLRAAKQSMKAKGLHVDGRPPWDQL